MVGLEIAVVEHHGFDGRQLLPGLRLKQGLGFDLIDKSNEIEVCSVLRLDFVEQVNARVIGKEPVLAVVKLQVHATGGEREHGQHDHCKGLLGTVDTPVSQHHERISHDFCTFFSLITVRLFSAPTPEFPLALCLEIPSSSSFSMNQETLYFGYGSNLDAEDWAAWCRKRGADPTSMVELGPAWLLDHSLRFHYRSTGRGGGAADVVRDSRGTAVPGALFSLSEEGWEWMNRKEGHPKVYRQTPVRAITVEGEVVEAITYVVQPKHQRGELVVPTAAYAELIERAFKRENYQLNI